MSLSHGDQVFWLVFITIDNLNIKMRSTQNWPNTSLLDFILIVHGQVEDPNNKDRDLKAQIYHLALETMLKRL